MRLCVRSPINFLTLLSLALVGTACFKPTLKAKNVTSATSISGPTTMVCSILDYTQAVTNLTSVDLSVPAVTPTTVQIIYEAGNYYAFIPSRDNGRILRLDYGSSLSNAPAIVNLGNLGGVIVAPSALKIVKVGSTYYGFVGDNSTGTIMRLDFPGGINTVPTATDLGRFGMSGQVRSIDVAQDGANWFIVAAEANSGEVFTINLGASITGALTMANTNTTRAVMGWNVDAKVIKDGSHWYGLVTNYGFNSGSPDLWRLDYGNSLANRPTMTKIATALPFRLDGISLFRRPDGIFQAIVAADTAAYVFDFGFTMSGPIQNTTMITGLPATTTLYSLDHYTDANGTNYLLGVDSGAAKVIGWTVGSTKSICPITLSSTAPAGGIPDTSVPACSANQDLTHTGSVDALKVPSGNSGADAANTIDFIQYGGNWYGFMPVIFGNTVQRLDFGNSLGNYPTSTMIDNTIPEPTSIRMVKQGANYYGVVISYNTSNVYRLSFGTDPTSLPTVTNLGSFGTGTLSTAALIFDGTNYHAYVTENGAGKIHRLSFGNSMANAPALTTIATLANAYGIMEAFDGTNYFLFATNLYNSVYRLDLGANAANNAPTVNLVAAQPNVVDLNFFKIGANYYLYASANYTVYQYALGATINSVPTITTINPYDTGMPYGAQGYRIAGVYPDLFMFAGIIYTGAPKITDRTYRAKFKCM